MLEGGGRPPKPEAIATARSTLCCIAAVAGTPQVGPFALAITHTADVLFAADPVALQCNVSPWCFSYGASGAIQWHSPPSGARFWLHFGEVRRRPRTTAPHFPQCQDLFGYIARAALLYAEDCVPYTHFFIDSGFFSLVLFAQIRI